jgi:ribonuclease R
VDRLTKCVEFVLAPDGRVLKTRFYPAVIHSKRRFSYQEVFGILQRSPSGAVEEMLHRAHHLAQSSRQRRFKAGALALDFPEMKIRLDEHGAVLRIEKVENDISHQLIEEFMLLANEAVAARLLQLKRDTIHRVHEEPDPRRLQEFREEVLSHNVPCGNLANRAEVQKLLHRLDTLTIGPALKIGFLKSLMRARYAVEPLGHYGLAKQHYAHFTSPIRRYADLVVHRSLFPEGRDAKRSMPSMAEAADHISTAERNSADAERDSKDVKLYAFLNAQLESGRPQSYAALVTDLRNFGFFVDVPDLAMSGLVPFSELGDDFYSFDAARLIVIGRRSRRIIKLGDRVEVQVAKVDRFKKRVDFRLSQRDQSGQRSQTSRASRSSAQTSRDRDALSRPFESPIPSRQDREVPPRWPRRSDQSSARQRPAPRPQERETFRTTGSKQPPLERAQRRHQPRQGAGRRRAPYSTSTRSKRG